LLAGLLACGRCGRRLESAWSNGKPAYRCRRGYTSASHPEPRRPKNTYVREEQILPHLAAVAILLGRDEAPPDGGVQITAPDETAALIDKLRTAGITLTYDPETRTLRIGDSSIAAVAVGLDCLHRNSSTRKEEGKPPKGTRHGRRLGPGDVPACPETGTYGDLTCPRGDLNTETGAISPDRGNHAIRLTRPGRMRPGIPRRVRYLVRCLACM
jgi:hypothetical protein